MRGVEVFDDSDTSLSSECCRRSAGRVLSPLVDVGQLTADRCRCPRRVAEVQGLYPSCGALERSYNSEVEVVADLAGLLSDRQTDGLVSCNAAAARR